jgi:hypothetical protein
MREERKSERLANERKLSTFGREECAVWINGAGESLGKPVQRDVGQDVIDGGGGVAPFDEFLTNPRNGALGDSSASVRTRVDSYHANRASGLEDSTRPIVLGRLACSNA